MSIKNQVSARAIRLPDARRIWIGSMMMVMILVTLLIAGCGSGDAKEPGGPQLPVVQIPGAGGGTGPGAGAGGTSTPAGSSGGATTPVAQLDACNIDKLNAGRFAGTGLVVVAVIDETQCPICSSGESCTTNAGQCRCLVVASG